MAVSGLISRLRAGLVRTSSKIASSVGSVFDGKRVDNETLSELEDILIAGDLGVVTAQSLVSELASRKWHKNVTETEVREDLSNQIAGILEPLAQPFEPDARHCPHVAVFAGVNGTGKTTTIGKLSSQHIAQGKTVTLAACDTFRAAAIEQLQIWGKRTGAQTIAGNPGADAAGLAFDALKTAQGNGSNLLFIDTAGRLQNKNTLMAELEKIIRVLGKLDPSAPHDRILVLDATTGQNVISQVKTFQEMCGITGLIITKLDGSARGGVIVSLAEKFALPVHAIGVGEQAEDLQPFVARDFARALMGLA